MHESTLILTIAVLVAFYFLWKHYYSEDKTGEYVSRASATPREYVVNKRFVSAQ